MVLLKMAGKAETCSLS